MKCYSLLKNKAKLKWGTLFRPWKAFLLIGLSGFLLATMLPATLAKADTGQYSVNINSSLSNGLIEVEIEGAPPELFVTVKNNSGAFPGTGGLWQAISYKTIGNVTVEPLSLFGEFGILAPDSWNYYSVRVEGQGAITFSSDITSDRVKVYYAFQNFFRLFPELNIVMGETPELIVELAATFDDLREVIESFVQAFSPELGFFERVRLALNGATGIVDFLATEENLAELSVFIWDKTGPQLAQVGIADESMLFSTLKKAIRLKDIGEVLLSSTQMMAYSLSGTVAGSTIIEIFEKPEEDITPRLSVSPESGTPGTRFEVEWTGFSPSHNLAQSLRRKGESEKEIVLVTTDSQGRAISSIDSRVLSAGNYELWGVDGRSGNESNIVEFTVSGEVDLSAYIVSLSPSSVAPTEGFSVTFAVNNHGNSSSGSFFTWVYASTSPYGTENLLTKVPFESIAPGNSQTVSVKVVVPSSLDSGEYNITAYADAPGDGVVNESREDNNIGSSTPNQLIIQDQPQEIVLPPPEPVQNANGWYWPLGTGDTGRYLGWLALNPNNNSYHLGHDFEGLESWPVYAIADGEVILSGVNIRGYGHGDTLGGALVARFTTSTGQQFLALYGHISKPHSEGTVKPREILGYLNDYDPPHLHFGIYLHSEIPEKPWQGYTSNPKITYEWVDPLDFLAEYAPGMLKPVTLKLYVHENSTSGPIISGVQVTGQDGEGNSFSEYTNSAGYVTITGAPGTWQFTASKTDYQPKSWSQSITADDTEHVYIIEQEPDVTLKLYVHENSSSGPVISGALVTGQDGEGNSFSEYTNSNGYVTITGAPGTWQFTASKTDYQQKSWSQSIAVDDTEHAYLIEQEPDVTLKLYVHEGSTSGPVISGALVTGQDGDGKSFSEYTNSAGYVTIIGAPGTWSFTASKSDYYTNSWSQSITADDTKHAYLIKPVSDINLKLYVHEGSTSGPIISGALVTGQDGEGNSFSEYTNSSGYVTIIGAPGTWQFTASKSGYYPNSWSQSITTDDTKHAYIIIEEPSSYPPTLVDVGIASSPWPPQTFLQASPGDTIYTLYTFSYSGPNMLVNLKTAILDTSGNEIGNQVSGPGLWIINPFENPISGVGVEYRLSDEAIPGIYNVRFSIWNEDFTEQYDSVLKSGWLEITSGEVTLTLYVHENSTSGPIVSGATVTGQDWEGNSFSQVTNSSGYVTITGDPGTWSFTASRSGYETNSWSQSITTDDTKHAYLIKQTTAPTSAPTHVSPSNGASGVSTRPTFQWQAVSDATFYGLYISEPPYGEANLVFDSEEDYGSITGTSFTLPFDLEGGITYRWNMRAGNNAGWGDFSSSMSFTTETTSPPPVPPEPPSLVAPSGSGQSLTPLFQWSPISDADHYGLYISEPPYGPSNLVYENESLTGTSLTLPSGILSEGITYYWNMRSHNSAGWGDFSSSWSFTTSQTPVPLTLYVHEDSASGPIISGVTVTGQDGGGNSFSQVTNSNGYATITGVPGTWSFTASKSGYETNTWSQSITATDTKHAYLVKEIAIPSSFTLSGQALCDGNSPYNHLSWNSSSGATSYAVYRDGSLYYNLTTLGTTFENTEVSSGTTYTYFIRATNAAGSTDSNTITITTRSDCAPAAKFNIGDRVQVTTNLNVRTGPGTGHPEITDPDYPGYAPAGTIGTVLSGPVSADGYVWWQIQYDAGYTGWSVEGGLDKI